MRLKALFWDNDGVLVDTEHLYYESNRVILAELGIELTEAEFAEKSLRQGGSVFDAAYEKGIPEDKIKEAQRRRDADFTRLIKEAGPELVIPGVKDVLEKLSEHFIMGIVTSCRKEHFTAIHRHSGILNFFDFVLANGDYEYSKPHPSPYLTALKKTGLLPARCAVIEDSERGVLAATAAGIRCYAIPNGISSAGSFEPAHKILDSVKRLPEELGVVCGEKGT